MQAVHQTSHVGRLWQLIAITGLLLALAIGGTAGYVVRLATDHTLTEVHTAPAVRALSPANATGPDDVPCVKPAGVPHGVTC